MDSKAEQNKKYRYTKQLINMALRDGWTQTTIAEACRTQQSIVSKWKSGAAQAKQVQLTKLLEIYGPKLRRQSFKIYHSLAFDDKENKYQTQMIKVEGSVLLSFPYSNAEFCSKCLRISTETAVHGGNRCHCSSSIKKQLPTKKLIFHTMGHGEFCVVKQQRLIRTEKLMHFPETSIFISDVIGQWSIKDLLNFVDNECFNEKEKFDLADKIILQLLLRKALLENGYPVEGVEEHLAAW